MGFQNNRWHFPSARNLNGSARCQQGGRRAARLPGCACGRVCVLPCVCAVQSSFALSAQHPGRHTPRPRTSSLNNHPEKKNTSQTQCKYAHFLPSFYSSSKNYTTKMLPAGNQGLEEKASASVKWGRQKQKQKQKKRTQIHRQYDFDYVF